ncbi:unnamed protein product [Gulo gulo]|uniref:Uncharacterized protein n=1 Tax=Gulo gulo TaxID=48420 RepID=A0A9X9MDQ6_GULGU|nr:unnamed protein product [Gulo gulo]
MSIRHMTHGAASGQDTAEAACLATATGDHTPATHLPSAPRAQHPEILMPGFPPNTRRLREEKIPCGVHTPEEGPLLGAASGAASPGRPETAWSCVLDGSSRPPSTPTASDPSPPGRTRSLPEGLTVLTKTLTYLPACPVLRCPRSLTL